jgi:hypothetical protein
MSLLPKPSPEEFEELFQLFREALVQPRITPTQARAWQKQLRERLQQFWDAIDPKPFPVVFDDFRRSIMDDFYDRLRKEDSSFRRPRS